MLKIKASGKAQAVATEKSNAKVVHKVKTGAITDEQKLIDELVEIDEFLKTTGVQPKLKRVEEIKKVLQSIAKDQPIDQEVVLAGTVGEVTFSAGRREVEVTDKNALIKALKQDLFNSIANVSVGELKKYLSENELAKFTAVVYGSRALKTVKKYG